MELSTTTPVRLPSSRTPALVVLGRRLLFALALITLVALVAYLERAGYRDGDEVGDMTLLDAFYYASVSVTTTGYGDITPVTQGARLTNILVITPARILFLILLVGTTVEVLAETSRQAYRRTLWRKRLRDHTIICGYGTKGRNAAQSLVGSGIPADQIVIVDPDADAVEEATRAGFAAVHGKSTRTAVLLEAGVETAAGVIIAPDTDEASILTTLTAREHNKGATIVASVREPENRHLLHESGANSAIVSSGAAGRMLGLATKSPALVEVLEDLMTLGTGLDIAEHQVRPEDVGKLVSEAQTVAPVIAVVRNGSTLRFDEAGPLEHGDQLVCLCTNQDAA